MITFAFLESDHRVAGRMGRSNRNQVDDFTVHMQLTGAPMP